MQRKQTPETALKSQAKDLLALFDIWTFPVLQGLGAYLGIADRLGIWEKGTCPHCQGQVSQPLALEAKAPGGKMTDKQIAFQEQWVKRGGLYVMFKSVKELGDALSLPLMQF